MDIKNPLNQENIILLLDELYKKAQTGVERISPPVDKLANDYLTKHHTPEQAAKSMISNQIAKCTTSGFVTGFGGLITLPIAIPANISSVLYVQMRMIACTAYMAGYDLNSDQVQTMVYACLAGISLNEIFKQTGIKLGQKIAVKAIERIPGKTLTRINQKIGFRLVTKFGEKGFFNLGKMVPGVGAVINGGLDFVETKMIGDRAYKLFFKGESVESKDDYVIIDETEEMKPQDDLEASEV